jgi:hypothetical protein
MDNQKLGLFKVVDDKLELCGYFDTTEQITEYLGEVTQMIETSFQHQLEGEYLAIPSLYYNLKRK